MTYGSVSHAPTQVKSSKKAAKLWKRAVELGNVDSMMNLGYLYEVGDGVKQDTRKALQLYRMGGDRGDANAACKAGKLLHHLGRGGLGTPQEAFRYYKIAAEAGVTEAIFYTGVAYRRGEGCDEDEEAALHWFERGAAGSDLGSEKCRNSLAFMHAYMAMPP